MITAWNFPGRYHFKEVEKAFLIYHLGQPFVIFYNMDSGRMRKLMAKE